MSSAELSAIVTRLEAATAKIELLAGNVAGGSTINSANADAKETKGIPKNLAAWDDFIASSLPNLENAAISIGGVVLEQFAHFKNALQEQRNYIQMASSCKKPNSSELPRLIAPIQSHMEKAIQLKEKNRASPFFSHLNVLAEGIPALGWLLVEPTPVPFVGDMKEASLFYVNRIIKDFKDKEKHHGEYVSAFKELLTQLQAYVKANHTTGVSWNPKGQDTNAYISTNATKADTKAVSSDSAGAPPPPPAPSAAQLESLTQSGGSTDTLKSTTNGAKALFDELSKGNVTAGLRKVDQSQMTHKNPNLRATGLVKDEGSKEDLGKKPTNAPTGKAPLVPKCELQGNKWTVENYVNDQSIVIEKVELKHVVYIYNCNQATIQINGKVNAVTIDGCKKSGIVVKSAVSTVDIVNSKSIQLQITGQVPTVVVDNTEGVQLFLSEESLQLELFTAKSTSINVLSEVDGEVLERAVPEQLKSVFNKKTGKLESAPVEHKG